MSWFDRLINKKPSGTAHSTPGVYGGQWFTAGTIDEKAIMKIPTAKACVDLVAGMIAPLHVKLYKENSDGEIEEILNDERLKLLNDNPNDYAKGHNVKRTMVKDLMIHGHSFTFVDAISTTGGLKILSLSPVDAEDVMVDKYYFPDKPMLQSAKIRVTTKDGKESSYFTYQFIIATNSHDGLTGIGVIETGENIFRKAILETKQSSNFYERNGVPLGILSTDQNLNPDQLADVESRWNQKYTGWQNSGKTPVLNGGMKYQQLQATVLDNTVERESINEEICKLMNVPYEKISANKNGTGKNLEETNRAFLQSCLNPIIENMEAAINYTLLLEKEKDAGYYFKFDIGEIEKASQKDLIESVTKGWQSGLLTQNEGRYKLDLPTLENGDVFYYVPGAFTADDEGNSTGQNVNDAKPSANASDDVKNEVDTDEN